MVSRGYKKLSLKRQCDLLGVNRSSIYYAAKPESDLNLVLMKKIDALFLNCPFYGSRKIKVRRYQMIGQNYRKVKAKSLYYAAIFF